MLILLPILFLLFMPVIMLVIRLFRPDFAYHWLIAAAGALVAWFVVLFAGFRLPMVVPLIAWQPETLFPSALMLLVDRLSYPYVVGLTTLVLAMILTEVARAPQAGWSAWATSLLLVGLGILAVLSGNPLTLLVSWTAIDLVELLVMLGQVSQSKLRERVVIAFSVRVLGSGMLMGAMLSTSAVGNELTFTDIPPIATVFLLLAVGLRIGLLPSYMPILRELHLRRSLGTLLHLVVAAAGLVLVNRTAAVMVSSTTISFLLGLVGLASLYGGVAWVMATDEISGRPAWVLGMASLSAAAAMNSQPLASQAWGIAVLLAGGVLFYTSTLDQRFSWLPLLGLLGISALPFTPTWSGALLFTSPFNPLMVVFLLSHVLLMVGYVRHVLRPREPLVGVERWVWLIYPLGLGLLPMVHYLYGWWANPGADIMPTFGWWAGAIASVITAFLVGLSRFMPRFSFSKASVLESVFSLKWLYRLFWVFYRSVEGLITFLTTVLEGDGGLLWAFLLLVLLFSLVVGNSGG